MKKATSDTNIAKAGAIGRKLHAPGITLRRYILLFVSVFVNAFGIVLITKAALGTSPISSVPYVLSLATPLSFGTYTFIMNFIFIVLEMVLMGGRTVRAKRMELVLQLPVVVVFSSSIDLSMFLIRDFVPRNYPEMIICLVIGCVILASGIGWAVKADVTMNPGEYLVSVISKRLHRAFGNVKLCFDAVLVALALLLSLLFMFAVAGIREGTIISALLVGPLCRLLSPLWNIFDVWLSGGKE